MADKEAEGYSAAKIFEPGRLVMDPAMLKLLPADKLRNIAVIAMKANLAAAQAYMKAQENIIQELEKMNVK